MRQFVHCLSDHRPFGAPRLWSYDFGGTMRCAGLLLVLAGIASGRELELQG
jgi:hypothetical protein